MAGDWIKMRKSLPTDPRVVRMASALDADRLRTLGALLSAWCLLDEHTEDGHLAGYTARAFDEIVGVDGLAEAMQSVGWLSITPEGITAPNFTGHNGATARRRAQESVRKMSARDADKKRPREEKRREENNKEEVAASGSPAPTPPEDTWEIPESLDTPEVRTLLDRFAAMRKRIKKPIKSKADASTVLKRFDSVPHLVFALETCIGNDYQGLKPEYRPSQTAGSHTNGNAPISKPLPLLRQKVAR